MIKITVKVSQNNMSCVDLCASAFTEIPDTCTYTYTLKKSIEHTDLKKCIDNENINFLLSYPTFSAGAFVVKKILNNTRFL